MEAFFVRALLGGIGIALIAGPLGSFIVWRRMAYFGDTLSHSALLGIALALLFDWNLTFGIALICVLLAIALVGLQPQRQLPTDTLLGIFSHTALSLGLIAVTFLDHVRVDLMGYLFGDILAVSAMDVLTIWAGAVVVGVILVSLWRPLLRLTINQDLAEVEGVPVFTVRLVFMLLVAVVIALAMKIVGVLLITSLLLIPAATARRFATTPETMATLASLIGAVSVVLGLLASLRWDTPTGPSIVVAAAALFCVSVAAPGGKQA